MPQPNDQVIEGEVGLGCWDGGILGPNSLVGQSDSYESPRLVGNSSWPSCLKGGLTLGRV